MRTALFFCGEAATAVAECRRAKKYASKSGKFYEKLEHVFPV